MSDDYFNAAPPFQNLLEYLLKRLLSALALAAALMLPAALAPSSAAAGYCSSQTVGSNTFTNCSDDRGNTSSDTSISVGSTDFHSGYSSDGSSWTGTTIRTGRDAFTSWNTYP